jgi:SNF2 family DNA or RNA helicase
MLEIKHAFVPGFVEISASLECSQSVRVLQARFPRTEGLGASAFTLSVQDLLTHLKVLKEWTSLQPGDEVRWAPDVKRLVEQNLTDRAVVATELDGGQEGIAQSSGQIELGDDWVASLTDEQLRDLRKLVALSHGANFSVPGAGKTRVALANFQVRRRAGEVERMLVVAPKSAFESWRTEAELCFSGDGPTVRLLTDGEFTGACDVLIVNYERLPTAEGELIEYLRARPSLLVLDEAHRMKAGEVGVWGAICMRIGIFAAHRLILSGTPAPNGPVDLENLFGFVWPGQGKSAVRAAVASRDLRAASKQLSPLFARTQKNELGLPEMAVCRQSVVLPELHRKLYDALLGFESGIAARAPNDLERLGRIVMYMIMAATTPALLAQGTTRYEPLSFRVPPLVAPQGSELAELLRDLPSYEIPPKYSKALGIVSDNAQRNKKTLVWSNFVRNLTSLERLFEPFAPALVYGGTEDRAEQLARFREDEDCYVLLANPATLGEGISLHMACHDAVYIDRDFAAGRFMQSVDRIHRLGLPPETETTVTVLEAEATIDVVVGDRLKRKIDFMSKVLNDPDVGKLADLDEPSGESQVMDADDVAALLKHLRSADDNQ